MQFDSLVLIYPPDSEIAQGKDILLYYRGPFNNQIISTMLPAFRAKLPGDVVGKRVFAIFVELVYNIANHSIEVVRQEGGDLDRAGIGCVMVSEDNNKYSLFASNLIDEQNYLSLEKYRQVISYADAVQLREIKREIQSRPLKEGQKSGSFGLIQVALKADSTPEVDFHKVKDGLFYFLIKVEVAKL